MIVTASVLSNESEILDGVNVVEVATGKTTTTDAAGRFSINVASGDSLLRFSHVGYDFDTFAAKDIKSIVYLYSTQLNDVNVVSHAPATASNNNTFLYLIGLAVVGFVGKKMFGKKKPQPRKVTIR